MKKKYLALSLLVITTLSSCSILDDFLNNLLSEPPPTSLTLPPPTNVINTYEHETSENNYYRRKKNPYSNRALTDTWNVSTLNSSGDQKLLVVPISFKGGPTYGSETLIKRNLDRAFFGESSDTGWESVASYYNKTSYDKFSLTGEVTDVFQSNMTTTELEAKPLVKDQYSDQTYYMLEDIYNHHLSPEKLQEYDQDGDGYVDAIFLIYLAPYGESDLFWAFQYYWNLPSSLQKPVFSTYAWASYEFMYEDTNYSAAKPAAHTYIHEFGHILGLDDYYDYDKKSAPIGGKDMMDYNIGDHNMHSKYTLNWALPYVPTGSSQITLEPAESSGDFILINDAWNGHAYDEYILIEYYTPTGLNEKDALGVGYGPTRGRVKNFTVPGVRIFHIDARLIYYNTRGMIEWTNVIKKGGGGTDVGASNTASNSEHELFKRIHLLDAAAGTNTWYHSASKEAGNSALFQPGDKINADEWQKYTFASSTFNTHKPIGYTIEIGAMNSEGVTILLTKV